MSDEKVLIWVHEDCLHPNSPALQTYPDAPRVFVFDEAATPVSLKRIVFQYECLLEIPRIEIRRGEVTAELSQAAREYDCQRIVTVASVAPHFAQVVSTLQRSHKLSMTVLAVEPFLELSPSEADRLDLKRFSRFWHAIKGRALNLNQAFDW
jgi:hypothetical protein